MQFWKALNYLPIFMIAYTYEIRTSLLEETSLRINSSGKEILRKALRAQAAAQTAVPALRDLAT